MKALADVPVGFDRISTHEELEQVLGLLLDFDTPEDGDIALPPAPIESWHTASQSEFSGDVSASEAKARLIDLRTLTSLFLGTHDRTH